MASNLYGITPDVITLAKGLGGGVPIGAIMTTHKDIFSPGDHGSTFGGNYLSTTAALEVLAILSEYAENGILAQTIADFDAALQALAEKYEHMFDGVVGLGLLRGLRAKSDELQKQIINEAFKQGLLVLKAGQGTVRLAPALTLTSEELSEGFARFDKALASLG